MIVYLTQKTKRERRNEALKKLAYYTLNPLWMFAAFALFTIFTLSLGN